MAESSESMLSDKILSHSPPRPFGNSEHSKQYRNEYSSKYFSVYLLLGLKPFSPIDEHPAVRNRAVFLININFQSHTS